MGPAGTSIKFIDLDKDGDPDLLETLTINNTPVRWIDDDDHMKTTDMEGYTDSDWDTFELRCWIHQGQSDFYEDYHGKSIFMKIHSTTEKMSDVRLNWENPFLFYDTDNDGLTEMAIRLCDSPPYLNDRTLP